MNVAQWVAPATIQMRRGGRRAPEGGDVVVGVSSATVAGPNAHHAHAIEPVASVAGLIPYPEHPSARTRLRTGDLVEVAAYDGPGYVAIQILRTTNGCPTHSVATDMTMVGAEKAHGASDGSAATGTVAAAAITRMAQALREQTEFDFAGLCPSFELVKAIVACYGEIYVIGTGMVSFLTVADAPATDKASWRVTFFWSHDPVNWNFLERLGLVQRKRLEARGTSRLRNEKRPAGAISSRIAFHELEGMRSTGSP